MNSVIYFDNSSTTKPCRTATENMRISMEENWGNPSSLHILGMNAEAAINNARKALGGLLKCDSREIVFTAGGTEANNIAIFGAAAKGKKRGGRVVTTSIEHPSVLECFRRLEEEGFEVIRLSPDSSGTVPLQSIENAVNSDTVLFSMMLVNNEMGTIEPVREAAEIVRKKAPKALIHCDAVQAFGKIPFTPQKLGVDLLSISAHKVHGPKGIGALYIKRGVILPPLILGGGQEGGMRSGTESVPLICGFKGAIDELSDIAKNLERTKILRDYAIEQLGACDFARINSTENALAYILNISVPHYRSETLLHFLESKNIFVSSGSACAKGEGSYVLRECGFDRQRIDSALRISFSRYNTKEEIDALITALREAVTKIRKAQK